MRGFIAGICATLAIEAVFAATVVYGAWKYDTVRSDDKQK